MSIWQTIIIALVTGLLGACIGAATSWRIFKRQSAKTVVLKAGLETYHLPKNNRPPWHKLFYVKVLNKSISRSLEIDSIKMIVDGIPTIELAGALSQMHWGKIPCVIPPDSSETFWMDFGELKRALEPLGSDKLRCRIVVTDRMDVEYTIKRVSFDRAEVGKDMRNASNA